MGEFLKILAEKTDLELTEIGDSILDYQALFIIDYLFELDQRGLLFDYKIMISNSLLIDVAVKIECIHDSIYPDLLRKEIDLRKITSLYEQLLKAKSRIELDRNSKKWYSILFEGMFNILKIIFVLCIAIIWILYKEGIFNSKKKKNNPEIIYKIPEHIHTNPNIETPSLKIPVNESNKKQTNPTTDQNIHIESFQNSTTPNKIPQLNVIKPPRIDERTLKVLDELKGGNSNALSKDPRFRLNTNIYDTINRIN
jgi:hypothetical protein